MNRNSRLLQLVVAGVLLGHAAGADATIYDDERVAVPGDFWGGASTSVDPYENYYGGYTDFVLNDIDYSNGGSGGSGIDGTNQADVDDTALCNAISDLVPADCDLRNPPLLTVNGCGGGMFTYAVPDYLAINGVPNFRLGPIFKKACDLHDTCYGTYLMSKDACDAQLAKDMVILAQDSLSSFQWFIWHNPISSQAVLYSSALQTAPILSIANGLYDIAQGSGACRAYSDDAEAAGCLD